MLAVDEGMQMDLRDVQEANADSPKVETLHALIN
jgi:hypothetical protein